MNMIDWLTVNFMQPAARIGIDTVFGGILINGSPTVLVNSLPVAVLGSFVGPHSPCGDDGQEQHCSSNIITASSTVFAGGIPIARMGDFSSCGHFIVTGSQNVFIG